MALWKDMSVATLTVATLLAGAALANEGPRPQDSTAAGKQQQDQIAGWIRDLGSDSFAARERATRELIESGIASRDALTVAAADPDAEVRTRARAILATVFETDFRDRLEAFSADFDGSHRRTLPGWEAFSAHFGSGTLARQLFVDMQRAEPDLLESLVSGPKETSVALEARCRAIIQVATQSHSGGRVSMGTVASLLFVAGAQGVTVDDYVGMQFLPWLIYQPSFQKAAQNGEQSAMLKKLVGAWIVKETSPNVTAENLKFAAMFDLKPEGLTVATRVLADERTQAAPRQAAILIIGRFGDKQLVPLVEKFLTDETVCGAVQMPGAPGQVEVQVRDAALAVIVQLTNQELKDYGHVLRQPSPVAMFQINTLLFAQPELREKALKKWSQWRSEHPQG